MEGTATAAVSILTELAGYAEAHVQGRQHQQASVWNLTKARRFVHARTNGNIVSAGHTTLTAHSILRAELTPTRTIEIITEPNACSDDDDDDIDLLDENDKAKRKEKFSQGIGGSFDKPFPKIASFTLIHISSTSSDEIDTLNVKENTPENQEEQDVFTSTSKIPNESTGLRQRKGATTTTTTTNKSNKDAWKAKPAVTKSSLSSTNVKHPETDLLVTLFATMPPAELIKAQAQAVASLEAYCKAATLVAKLIAALPPPSRS